MNPLPSRTAKNKCQKTPNCKTKSCLARPNQNQTKPNQTNSSTTINRTAQIKQEPNRTKPNRTESSGTTNDRTTYVRVKSILQVRVSMKSSPLPLNLAKVPLYFILKKSWTQPKQRTVYSTATRLLQGNRFAAGNNGRSNPSNMHDSAQTAPMFVHAQGRPSPRPHSQANRVGTESGVPSIRNRRTTCSLRRLFSDELSFAKTSFEQTIDLIAGVYLVFMCIYFGIYLYLATWSVCCS